MAGSQGNLSKGMSDGSDQQYGWRTSVKPSGRSWKGGLRTGCDKLATEGVQEKVGTH